MASFSISGLIEYDISIRSYCESRDTQSSSIEIETEFPFRKVFLIALRSLFKMFTRTDFVCHVKKRLRVFLDV